MRSGRREVETERQYGWDDLSDYVVWERRASITGTADVLTFSPQPSTWFTKHGPKNIDYVAVVWAKNSLEVQGE